MPASLLMDMNSHSGGLEDKRALQIALELSKLGLDNASPPNGDERTPVTTSSGLGHFDNDHVRKSANMTECVPVPSSEHVAEIVGRQGE